MAKGQIHFGKNGPEKCRADSSKPNARGCPYEATGHYSNMDEAVDNYSKLNRVSSKEVKELVADGTTPKDAVGLIRSGYGRDYLEASQKDKRVPESSHADYSADYIEAKKDIEETLRKEIGGSVSVQAVDRGKSALLVEAKRRGVVVNRILVESGESGPTLRGGSSKDNGLQSALKKAVDSQDGELRDKLSRALSSSEEMLSFERAGAKEE